MAERFRFQAELDFIRRHLIRRAYDPIAKAAHRFEFKAFFAQLLDVFPYGRPRTAEPFADFLSRQNSPFASANSSNSFFRVSDCAP